MVIPESIDFYLCSLGFPFDSGGDSKLKKFQPRESKHAYDTALYIPRKNLCSLY